MLAKKKEIKIGILMLAGLFFFGALSQASFAEKTDDGKILARIDETVITRTEFNREIASLHMTMVEESSDSVTAPAIDFQGVMHRLINLRLLALEARQIGLDEQPDFKRSLDQYRVQQLKQRVLRKVVEENPVTIEDEEVQTLYKRLSRELRMFSMLFANEADAKKAGIDIDKRGFVVVADELKTAENVQVSMEEGFLALKELSAYVGQIIIDMEPGDISPMFQVVDGLMVFQLVEIRQVEDEGVLKEALSIITQSRNAKVKTEFLEKLVDQYAEIDQQLLASVDYSSSGPDIEELKTDSNVLATLTVPGQEVAIFSVADLTTAMADKYYHGLEQARSSKQLNQAKESILRKRLMSWLLLAEAGRLEIEKSAEFAALMQDYENRMLFAEMTRKVIGTDVTFSTEEVEKYYTERQAEYLTPKMIRLSSIPFSTEESAEQAAEMMRKGADFSWLNKNAPGQVKTDEANLTRMTKKIVSLTGMPEDAHKALENLPEGQATWYAAEDGYIQVLYVDEIIPEKVKPLDEVRIEIEKAVFRQNVSQAINDYAKKARDHYAITIYDPDLKQEQSAWERIKSFFD